MKRVLLENLNLTASNLLSREEKKRLNGGFDPTTCGCWREGWAVCYEPMENSCDAWCGAMVPPGYDGCI